MVIRSLCKGSIKAGSHMCVPSDRNDTNDMTPGQTYMIARQSCSFHYLSRSVMPGVMSVVSFLSLRLQMCEPELIEVREHMNFGEVARL